MERLPRFVSDLPIIVSSFFREPVIVPFDLRQRMLEDKHLAEKLGSVSSEQARAEMSNNHFRRPIPLFGMDRFLRDGWAIRPFWRDHIRVVPRLPIVGRSGRIYKANEPIPIWESPL